MRRKIDVVIWESEPELQKLLFNEKSRLRLHRLSALYLYKTGQAKTYSAIGKLLGYERHTVSTWFNRYKDEGLNGLMKVDKPGPKEKTKLTRNVLNQLKAKLETETQSFQSYKEIQRWLADTCDVALSYSTVHSIVRYELDVDLKRQRHQRDAQGRPATAL